MQHLRQFQLQPLRRDQVIFIRFGHRNSISHLDNPLFDPLQFIPGTSQSQQQKKIRHRPHGNLALPDEVVECAAALCMKIGSDGLRGELTLIRAARALAALEGAKSVATSHLREIAVMSLQHRLRRNPLDDVGSASRIERALGEIFDA